MSTYNVADKIDECLESLLNQTYREFKIKIIDDNSTDDSVSKIKAWCDLDSRIELVKINQHNIGLTSCLNELL
ncbi:glycosyltransferase family 2 protein, partial [Bacillus sp. JJ1562]|uniref:glycosyltransferase family 2 protein n=1 Tax=Bacillus sp. JJ1562 TaxID=3122960 RepID=UPI00300128A4